MNIMLNKKINRFLQLAKKIAKKSNHPRYKFGCIIFKKNDIINIGYNQLKTHPKSPHLWKTIHAEFHTILGTDVSDLENSEIVIYMENKNGEVGLSKPCKTCENMLSNVGIKRIYYTTENGILYFDL